MNLKLHLYRLGAVALENNVGIKEGPCQVERVGGHISCCRDHLQHAGTALLNMSHFGDTNQDVYTAMQ